MLLEDEWIEQINFNKKYMYTDKWKCIATHSVFTSE